MNLVIRKWRKVLKGGIIKYKEYTEGFNRELHRVNLCKG